MFKRGLNLYRSSFTGLSRETWLLAVIMLINRSGTMVLPFMTLYLTSKGVDRTLSEAGTVVGLWGLGAIIGAFFGGKLTDKIGFHKVQLITLLCGGILFIILGQIRSYPLICLFTFILSTVNEAFRPANATAVAVYSTPENRTRSNSLNRLAINLGWALGVSVGGVIASYSYTLLFWVDGITNILAALSLLYFLKPVSQKKEDKAKELVLQPIQRSVYKDKNFLAFAFFTMLFGFCFFQMFSTVPSYFRDGLHLSEKYIGAIMALNGLLIVLIEMVLINFLEGKRHLMIYISFGTLLCGIAFLLLLLPLHGKIISLFMILMITFGEIISMPFMNSYWAARANDKNRGQYAALVTIAWSIGQTMGPYACSKLVEASSFNVMFVALGGLLCFTALGFNWLKSKD
ncbi:MAG: MFS transporter [Sphingobacteriaceae bacterium]|nr:MFS transporter [Sphingobacteriaceae bacterium]